MLAIARCQCAKFWQPRTATGLARLWHGRGKLQEDYEDYGLLAPSHGWLTEGLDTPDLGEAQTLPEELA